MKLLIVIDMQNDFVTGALGSPEAVAVVPYIKKAIEDFDGDVYFTRDTHGADYLSTHEGRKLPVPHCIKDSEGWNIIPELESLRKRDAIDKPTFGSTELVDIVGSYDSIESVTFMGVCTDICVISNAMLVKNFFPELTVIVDSKGCAGVTPEQHDTALSAMKPCQIEVI